MPTVPSDRLAKLAFYEAHIAPWTANTTAIGLVTASVTALTTAATNARTCYTAHVAAQAAAKAATAAFYDSIRTLHSAPGMGADMIQQIKTKAEITNNPAVYVMAQIPAPALPSPAPAPGTPTDFTVALKQDGSLELKWRCPNPAGVSGTIYQVLRRVSGATEFSLVGATGSRKFIDNTLPAGASPVTYQVTAVRSTASGAPAQFTVSFGIGGGGGATIESVVGGDGTRVKMAA
jgi:hypothetical protein